MAIKRLIRSIPFWVLVVASIAATAVGVDQLIARLNALDVVLTDGSASMSDLYVGQIWAVASAILAGIGLIGIAIALAVAAMASLAPAAVPAPQPTVWTAAPAEAVADAAPATPVPDTAPTDTTGR